MPKPSAELHYNLGVALYNQGRIEESIAAYSRAIQADPAFAKAYTNRGYAEFTRGRHSEALADLDEAVRLNPNDSVALSNRGAVLATFERDDEALADISRAIAIDPGNAQMFSDRAGIYLERDDVARATEDLERALALDANCAAAHYHFGALYARAGDLMKAYPCFARAARIGLAGAREALDRVLKMLYVQAVDDGSMQQATDSFIDARSVADFRALADNRPYVLLPDFYQIFLSEKYRHISGLRERAIILQELAHEHGILNPG